MGKIQIAALTPMDAWLLARATAGFIIEPSSLKQATPVVSGLIKFLTDVNPNARKQTVQMNLTPDAYVQYEQMNPDSRCPNDRYWEIIHANELKHLPPLQWLVPHEIPESGLTVLFGESGAGKSFVALDYALRIAQEAPVVYIPTEGEAGYRKRVAAWCQHNKKEEGALYFLFGAISLLEREILGLLLEDLMIIKPKLIVVDTLAMAMAGGDENSSRDMGIVMKACRAINYNLKTSVILVHHVGKAGVTERGSGALRGNADTMIRVNPADELILVECSKTKDEQPFEPRFMKLLPVNVEGVGESLVPVPAQQVLHQKGDPLTPNQKKILEYLSLETNADGATVRDISEATSLSLGTLNRTLSNLMRYKYVHKPFGSYTLTDDGRQMLNLDPLDPRVIHQKHSKLADDPLDPRDPSIRGQQMQHSGSGGSRGSSLKLVDQKVDQQWINGSDDDDDATQEALFPSPHTRKSSQYAYDRKGRR